MFWWRQCWWNQTIEAKATKTLQQPHIFLNAEGYEDIVCFRIVVEDINEKLQSFKSNIEDKAEWVVQTVMKIMWILEKRYDCKSYQAPIEDVSSVIDSNLRIFSSVTIHWTGLLDSHIFSFTHSAGTFVMLC